MNFSSSEAVELRALVLKLTEAGRHTLFYFVAHDPFQSTVYNMAVCFIRQYRRDKPESVGRTKLSFSVLESNLGSDIPSLLWNPIL